MAKPAPQSGLVIRYDYLWLEEGKDGRGEGSKERPCAVVVAVPPQGAHGLRAVLCAITHTPPAKPAEKIEIPARVKAQLGLDKNQSWIAVAEVNLVDWDDPGIVPVGPGRWAYGFLPPALARRVVEEVRRISALRKLGFVDRPAIEKRDERQS